MHPTQETFLYRVIIKLVAYTTKLIFHSVHTYFKTDNHFLDAPHPTIILANHVAEQDVVALAHIYPRIPQRIKFCFPMRQDIIEPNFLTKEFRRKGLIGFILWIIDQTKIIKLLLLYIGGIGVKRPFRDDARKLLKQGELRNLVDAQWDQLTEGITKGRNLFLFPEGKFSDTGNLDSIKRGTYLIFKRIANVPYNYCNFTYDFISESKPILHIRFGEISHFPDNIGEQQLAATIKSKLGHNYILTCGNVFSYFLFRDELKEGILEEILLQKIERFLKKIESSKKYFIAKDLLSPNLLSLLTTFLMKAIKFGFIQKDSAGIITATEKLATKNFRNGKEMRRRNIYLYHYNQLQYYFDDFEKFYLES